MKKMKKFLAMMLAMAMVLGMSLTTFAAGEPKITVSNVPAGATVKYEKIAEAEPTTPLGWSLVDGITLSNNVTLEALAAVAGGNTDAAAGTINSKQTVAQAIQNIDLTETATVTETTAEITGVTPGLYVIEVQATGYTFTRMLAYVAWNDDNTAAVENTPVQAKGAPDQVNKEITAAQGEDHTSVSAGDIVPFTVTAKYPYLAQTVANPVFTITDNVTGGTLQADSVVVTIGGVTAGATDVTVTPTQTGFTAVFDYDITKASQDVVITYNVVVSEGVDPLTNRVSSEISSINGGDPTKTESMVISPKVTATVEKVDGNNAALPGAEFTLYTKASQAEATHAVVGGKMVAVGDVAEGATVTAYVKAVGSAQATAYNDDQTKALTTFTGLDAQKEYWVAETKAPSGYSLNDAAYALTGAVITAGTPTVEPIDGKSVLVTRNDVKSNFTVNSGAAIVNTTLNSLPSTGGIGTTIFTIGGCAIMIIAAGLYFSLRRKTAK